MIPLACDPAGAARAEQLVALAGARSGIAADALEYRERVPTIDTITLEEAPSTLNPLGAKGAGEGGIVAVAAATANAVAAALAPLGVVVRELPLSAPNIARWIRDARGGA